MQILADRKTVPGLLTYYTSLLIFSASCISFWQNHNTLSVITFTLSLCAMLIQDIDWIRKSRIHPHDRQLMEKLAETLHENKTDRFLKDHDFTRYIYDDKNLAPLLDIHSNWRGVDYEYVNRKYQARWRDMQGKLSDLLDLLLNKPADEGNNFYHMLPPKDKREEFQDMAGRMQNAINANNLARDIYTGYQQFREIYLTKMQSK